MSFDTRVALKILLQAKEREYSYILIGKRKIKPEKKDWKSMKWIPSVTVIKVFSQEGKCDCEFKVSNQERDM